MSKLGRISYRVGGIGEHLRSLRTRYQILAVRESGGNGFDGPRRETRREWVADLPTRPSYHERIKAPDSIGGGYWLVLRAEPLDRSKR